ncbi:MAG: YebC/PmpR family DNA-binding transcriptional regulator [Candidatus Magasanikbacteria bacterium CG_4_10_14_0_8_um_filter_32_14]|uniref:Probable transcriptional regulatory protein COY69_02800 n=1 Tax=Candidatus Magasanikbacteria bacterium CG_4_10_14_0_8_um_filter_32_14 TaxID=1974640 RepID=A0A2M7R8X5_9BACT|nr:MAG: YebC/PmpR family DNA-binding transcriptional regulator [Candidatus Magasanikbacteria bacterium CG_4_10_14_0_8_um_filter_32_14]
MSGHSKWHNIQGKKGKADKARSNLFTKFAKTITVAAQLGGGDVEMNFSLRLAIDKAKEGNMPKDNIDRAIKRGIGELEGGVLQEVIYEGYGPGGIALLIKTVTDNINRTISELKGVFNKFNASLGAKGSVQWQFENVTVVRITTENKTKISNWDEAQLNLMDAGVDDIVESEEGVELIGAKEKFQSIMEVVEKLGIGVETSGLEWLPKETMEISPEHSASLEKLVDVLRDLDDIEDVYTNEF